MVRGRGGGHHKMLGSAKRCSGASAATNICAHVPRAERGAKIVERAFARDRTVRNAGLFTSAEPPKRKPNGYAAPADLGVKPTSSSR
jgi:hypothetical protein